MYARDQLRPRAIIIIIFQQQFSRLFIQRRFGIGKNEKAFHSYKDVADAVCRLPILLQRVDTYLPCRRDVRMEDFRCKPAYVCTWINKR